MNLAYCIYCNKEMIVDDKNFKLDQLRCTHENDIMNYLGGEAMVEFITKMNTPTPTAHMLPDAVPVELQPVGIPIELIGDAGTVTVIDDTVTDITWLP